MLPKEGGRVWVVNLNFHRNVFFRKKQGVVLRPAPRPRVNPLALDEYPVPHRPGEVAAGSDVGIVRHEDDGLAVVLGEPGQDVEDEGGVLDVQVSRGLVRQDDARLVRECARDGDPLLLPAREVGPQPVELVAKPHRIQEGAARSSISFGESRPSFFIGIMTFSSAVNSSMRKWNWKTKPMCSPRARVRTASSLFDISWPLIQISPASGWSRRPRR
jgi:hypothetical protein